MKLMEIINSIDPKNKLNENTGTWYVAEYYSNKTGHGEYGGDTNFDNALKLAIKRYTEEENSGDTEEDIEYIGVTGDGTDFAVVFATERYLKKVLHPGDFKTKNDYRVFLKAGLQVTKKNKPMKGRFEEL